MNERGKTPRQRPVIRLFVSSTFTDLRAERDALHQNVFPALESLCASRRFEFQAIDLRWGVSAEASLDHRTMRICFDELRRAQELSPQPNFIVLLGNRYGWRPLPEELSLGEFQLLDQAIESASERSVIARWYQMDKNSIPPVYILQPRQSTDQTSVGPSDEANWVVTQDILWSIINRAFPAQRLAERFNQPLKCPEATPTIVRLQASATEQEIWRGVFEVPDAADNVIAVMREIQNSDEFPAMLAHEYLDIDASGMVDVNAQGALRELKRALRETLYKRNVIDIGDVRLELTSESKGKQGLLATDRHLENFSNLVRTRLETIIQEQMDEYWGSTDAALATALDMAREVEEQQRFGEERGPDVSFVGRDPQLNAIEAYLADESRFPFIVHGPGGCGKTALIAQAARRAARYEPLVRFIGSSPRCSDLRTLFGSLCRELRLRLAKPGFLGGDVWLLSRELRRELESIPSTGPVVFFLDALDQLPDMWDAAVLEWLLVGPLPRKVKLVVSCLSGPELAEDQFQWFAWLNRHRLAESTYLEMDSLTRREAKTLLFDRWLPLANRTVTKEQRKHIEVRLESKACRRPLYLKVLVEEMLHWRSEDNVPLLGADVQALLASVFARLAAPTQHGPLVLHALAYLASARRGLSERELLELLHRDPDYRVHLDRVAEKTGHPVAKQPPRIPIALWSRLRFDLRALLTEHAAPGGSVLVFYHRQVEESVRSIFLRSPRDQQTRHWLLAQYFRDQTYFFESVGEQRARAQRLPITSRPTNARKVDELPWQCIRAASEPTDSRELRIGQIMDTGPMSEPLRQVVTLLTSLPLLEAKSEAELVFDLAEDFSATVQALPATEPVRELLVLLEKALRRDMPFIARHPTLLFQCLWNTCWWHDGSGAWRHYTSGRSLQRLRVPRPKGRGGLSGLLEQMHREKSTVTPEFRWLRSVRPPTVALGSSLIATLRGSNEGLISLAFSPDGRHLVTTGPHTVSLWDAQTGEQISALAGESLRVSFAGEHCLVATIEGREILVREGTSGRELARLRGHAREVDAIWLSPTGDRLISHSWHDGTIRLWNVLDATELKELDAQKWKMEHAQFSNDGTRVVIQERTGSWLFDRKEYIRIWDTTSGSEVASMTGEFDTALFSRNAKRFAVIPPYGFLTAPERIRLLDLVSGEELPALTPTERYGLAQVTLSPDGEHFAAAGREGLKIRLITRERFPVLRWNTRDGAALPPLQGHRGSIEALAFSPDSQWIASGSADKTVRLWRTTTNKRCIVLRGPSSGVDSVVFSPAGDLLLARAGDAIHVWETDRMQCRAVLRGHEGKITDMMVSNDAERIVSVAEDRTVRLWRTDREISTPRLTDHSGSIEGASASSDGRRLLTRAGGEARLWDSGAGLEISRLRAGGRWVRSAVFPDNGQFVCTASRGGGFRVHDAATGKRILEFQKSVDGASVAFSHDSRLLATTSGDNKSVHVWRLGTLPRTWLGQTTRRLYQKLSVSRPTLLKDGEKNSTVAFSPTGRLVASTHFSGVVLWDLCNPRERRRLSGHNSSVQCIAFSVDGRWLASGAGERYPRTGKYNYGPSPNNSVLLFDLSSDQLVHRFAGHTDLVSSVAFAPQATIVASGSRDHSVRIWDIVSGQEVTRLAGFDEPVMQVGFSSDGHQVFGVSMSCRICWDSKDFREIERICSTPIETAIHLMGNEVATYAIPTPLAHLIRIDVGTEQILTGARSNHCVFLQLCGPVSRVLSS